MSLRPRPAPARLLGIAAIVAAGTVLAGCLTPDLYDGQFTCTGGVCPSGFLCTGPPRFECVRNLDGGTPPDVPSGEDGPVDALDLGPIDVVDDAGRCVPDPLEPNDFQGDARSIGPGTNLPAGLPASSASLCPGEEDWYRVELDTSSVLLRLTAPALKGITLELRNARGTVVAEGRPQNGSLVASADGLPLAPHFVRVSGGGVKAPLAYGLFVASPRHDVCDGAMVVEPNTDGVFDVFARADNDYNPGPSGCTSRNETGQDLAFTFRLAAPGRVVLHADAYLTYLSMLLIPGSDPQLCEEADRRCVLGVSNLPGRLPRGADPLIDAELMAGDYFVVLSGIAPGMNAGALLTVHTGAECRGRSECDSTAPTYCVGFACLPVAGDLVEVPGGGQSLGVRDVPDGPPEGQMAGDMLVVPLEVDAGFLDTDRVAEVQVGLNIRHTWRGDLRVRLRSPPDPAEKGATREVLLVNRPADGGDFRNDLVALFPETLAPVESLDAMVGAPVRGTWTLIVEDTLQGDVGTLLDFRLFLRAQ